MTRRIRWAIAGFIAPDMAENAPKIRGCLLEIYRWTQYKNSDWARKSAEALGIVPKKAQP